MNTPAHRRATTEADQAHGVQQLELEVLEGGHEEEYEEQPHQESPHHEPHRSSFHHGEGSYAHGRRRPTVEEQVEELQKSFYGLSARFDIFVVDQRVE